RRRVMEARFEPGKRCYSPGPGSRIERRDPGLFLASARHACRFGTPTEWLSQLSTEVVHVYCILPAGDCRRPVCSTGAPPWTHGPRPQAVESTAVGCVCGVAAAGPRRALLPAARPWLSPQACYKRDWHLE